MGFALDAPLAHIAFGANRRFQVVDERAHPLSSDEIASLIECLERAAAATGIVDGLSVRITGDLRTHWGMGSGTGLRLACVEGLLHQHGHSQASSRDLLVPLSGRGGTSGVGIATYFSGGFAFDLGTSQGGAFSPSSTASPARPPLPLTTPSLPAWRVGLCLPWDCVPKTHEEEVVFFEENAPLSLERSYEAAYWSLFGAYAAIAEWDYAGFCSSVDRIQALEWKRRERAEYGTSLLSAERKLRELGADCVGMSSLGPMLYFCAADSVLARIAWDAPTLRSDVLITTMSSEGRILTAS